MLIVTHSLWSAAFKRQVGTTKESARAVHCRLSLAWAETCRSWIPVGLTETILVAKMTKLLALMCEKRTEFMSDKLHVTRKVNEA